MAATYEIVDNGTHSTITLKEGATSIRFWSIPKRGVTIQVQNGYLFLYFGQLLVIPKIPRTFIAVPSSANDEDLFDALSDFMTSDPSAASAITGAKNALSKVGNDAEFGGALTKNTTISGLFDLIFNGLKSLRFLNDIVQINNKGFIYFGDETQNDTIRIGLKDGQFVAEKRVTGVWTNLPFPTDAINGLSIVGGKVELGAALTKNTTISGLFDLIFSGLSALKFNTNIIEQQITGKYIWGGNAVEGSYQIGVEGGIFIVQRYISGNWLTINQESEGISSIRIGNVLKIQTAYSFDVSSILATTFLTLVMDANSQYAFNLTGVAIRTASNGNASYQSVGGARRRTLGNTLSGTASTIQLESLPGNFAITSALVGNTVEFRVTSSVATKTRLEGILTIQKTTIIDSF